MAGKGFNEGWRSVDGAAEEAARWVEDLRERDRRGLFFCTQTFFRISARKQ